MSIARSRLLFARIGPIVGWGVIIWVAAVRGAGPETWAAEMSGADGSQRYIPTKQQLRESYQRTQSAGQSRVRVYKAQITPHWFHNNTRFWYRNDLPGGAKEFIALDVNRGVREAAFDHQKLAAALSKATGAPYQSDRLPIDSIEFVDRAQVIRFRVGEVTWSCDLASYVCSRFEAALPLPNATPARLAPVSAEHEDLARLESPWPDELVPSSEAAPQQQKDQRRDPREQPENRARPSPDGKWVARINDNNVFVRSQEDGKEWQLSQDGKPGLTYGMLHWAPGSRTLVAFRIEPGDEKEVYLIESSPREGGRARLHTRRYALPGDKFASYELNLFDMANRQQTKPKVDRIDLGVPRLRWQRDGHTFAYVKTNRGHQRFRVIEVDTQSGKARNLIDEEAKTFIWTAHTETVPLTPVNWLERTEEIIYASERDGWRHLYLIDARAGEIKNQITKGEYVVRGIDRIDEANRQIWFRASGKNEDQDPYLLHHYRVDFDGTNLVALTEGNGNHTVQYSPDGKYLVDTYSRVDMPPVHELRRSSDGKLVCELEKADITELEVNGWKPPEVFVAKGRDAKTDIWGVIYRPSHLDPSKKYPVIEQIYAGPQGSFVPKTFNTARRFAALTELGFIVVQIDGMGTANRSKAFHDVCWKNLKDAGFPDRILWHRAVAKKYPYYDLDRVGIYGGSAGGQNSTAALLFHPEFYKVAVSGCGCHDNRMDKASWNEQWMGYPVGPQYAECSNITNAHKLQGKLLLIVGEMDTNVPPESTMRLVDALIKAGKDFDLLVVPGAGHGMGGAYGNRRLQDFFVRHLLGVEPPDRNAASVAASWHK
jgi:dipeptidyl aminopeptidase/acylaminoacyl peptidase